MIPISEIYDDVVLDNVNSVENGTISYSRFNRLSKRAELRMLDYISGDVENQKSIIEYVSQKDRDWVSEYVKPYPKQVVDGKITKPTDYYGFDNMYLMGQYVKENDCNNDIGDFKGKNTSIELLTGSKFTTRSQTYIQDLRPSLIKPIAKEVGNTFEFLPFDLGIVNLEYLAYPVFGKIVTKIDTVYNQEIVDEDKSTNYQYSEFARPLLIYWLTAEVSIFTRERALVENNMAYSRSAADEK